MRPLHLVILAFACAAISCSWTMPFAQRQALSPETQLDELVRTIDNNPDPAHADHTPSVHGLIELGDPAIPRMLNLMLLDGQYESNWLTRTRAEAVLSGIIDKKYGREAANALWKSLGNLDCDAPHEERERAVKLWREWLTQGQP